MKYLEYLKCPYKSRGTGPDGLDCYTLIKLFYRQEFRIELPEVDYTENWYEKDSGRMLAVLGEEAGFSVTESFDYGNLLIFKERGMAKHVGIVLSDEHFIHTTVSGTAIHSYRTGKWAGKIFRVLKHKDLLT